MKKRIKNNSTESGQILVLLALALLVLLVVAALAVDGGMLYAERRFAQNAADSSSLAAASVIANELVDAEIYNTTFFCPGDPIVNSSESIIQGTVQDAFNDGVSEAILRANTNNFTGLIEVNDIADLTNWDSTDSNEGRIYIECNKDREVKEKTYVDVYVALRTVTPTSFLHLINNDLLYSTVQAVTRFEPPYTLGYGNAIVALNRECPNATNGIVFGGVGNNEAYVRVTEGGLWSNYCVTLNAGEVYLIDADPDNGYVPATYLIDPDGVTNNSGILEPPDEVIVPSEAFINLTEEADEINDLMVNGENPPCNFSGTLEDIRITNGETVNLEPGTYELLDMSGQADTTFLNFINPHNLENPTYCFNGYVKINGGTVSGDPMTIYLNEGDFSISASTEANLIAPVAESNDTFNVLDGLLIFAAPGNTNLISLAGDSTSSFAGTIFTLDGDVKLAGNPVGTSAEEPTDPTLEEPQAYSTQIIANNVSFSGNVLLDIYYDLSSTAKMPGLISLQK